MHQKTLDSFLCGTKNFEASGKEIRYQEDTQWNVSIKKFVCTVRHVTLC
jgi:hypothetical protein